MARRRLSAAALAVSLALVGSSAPASHAASLSGRLLLAGDGIELFNPATGKLRQVATRGDEPAFLPSGSSFAYIGEGGCARDGHGGCFTEYSVFVKSLRDRDATDRGRRLFPWKAFFVREVDVSARGRLVFAAEPGPGFTAHGREMEIYSSTLAGRHVRRLTHNHVFENDPVVAPSGRLIAFSRRVHGRGQIFTMRIDGTHLRRVTKDGRRDRLPDFSPDGRRLAFISQPAGEGAFRRRDVRTVRTTGGGERTLAGSSRFEVNDPTYSPDGRSIAFLRSQSLWAMTPAGSDPHLVRRGKGPGGFEGGVDWAP